MAISICIICLWIKGADVPQGSKRCTEVYDPSVRCAYTDDDDILVRCAYTDDDGTNHATALQAWHVSDANSDDATIPTCVNNCPRNIGS